MTYVLIGFHGHVLLVAEGRLHAAPDFTREDLDGALLLTDDDLRSGFRVGAARFDWVAEKGGLGALRGVDGHLTCRRDGSLEYGQPTIGNWERFMPLPVQDVHRLAEAKAVAWKDHDSGRIIPPDTIRLVRAFQAEFGETAIPISHLAEALGDGALHLTLPDGTATRYDPTTEAPADEADPLIWIRPLGNTANRALSYLVARRIAAGVPDARIRNVRLPEWGMEDHAPDPDRENSCALGRMRFWIDVEGLSDVLSRGEIRTLVQDGYSYSVDFLPPRDECRRILGEMPGSEGVEGFGSGTLLCNIRGGEVLMGNFKSYIVLPPDYYRRIAEEANLDPVFFGQLGDDAYTESLQKAFPEARFINGSGAVHDFAVVRRSANVAIAVSTFSWLAAWLGHAERVYVPMGGMFHPNLQKHQNYITTADPAFRYVLLPHCLAEDLYGKPDAFFAAQALMARHARLLSAEEAEEIARRSIAQWSRQPRVGGFDSRFYLDRYPAAAASVAAGEYASALEHYLHVGAGRGNLPFRFDARDFLAANEDAAVALANAEYPDALAYAQARLMAERRLTAAATPAAAQAR